MLPTDIDVYVIGAGPAGLMASIVLAGAGLSVVCLEAMPRPLLKLRASGGGRCNLTNTDSPEMMADRFGRHGRFLLPALEHFSPDDLCSYMKRHGVGTSCVDGRHVFPTSNRAEDVAQALLADAARVGVKLQTSTTVTDLLVEDGAVRGLRIDGEIVPAGAVILASGGAGYSGLGGSESGLAMLRASGHRITPPVPGLVGLVVEDEALRACAGVSFEMGAVTLPGRGRKGHVERGPVLITHRGISGPAVLNLSATVARLLAEGRGVELLITPQPDLTEADWMDRLQRWRTTDGKKPLLKKLREVAPRRYVELLIKTAGAGDDLRLAEMPGQVQRTLSAALAGYACPVTRTEGFESAMVMAGGLRRKDVDPKTLQSRRVRGLYLAGEVIDLDGPCGGYNLTWAFASGHRAATSCVASLDGAGKIR